MENIYWSLLSFYNRDTLMRGACVLCFWFYAAVNVFFFLEYIGFMIDPEKRSRPRCEAGRDRSVNG